MARCASFFERGRLWRGWRCGGREGLILPYTAAAVVTRSLSTIVEIRCYVLIGCVCCSLTIFRSIFCLSQWRRLCAASFFSTFGATCTHFSPRPSLSPYDPLGVLLIAVLLPFRFFRFACPMLRIVFIMHNTGTGSSGRVTQVVRFRDRFPIW